MIEWGEGEGKGAKAFGCFGLSFISIQMRVFKKHL